MMNNINLDLTYIDPDKLQDKIEKISRDIVLIKNTLTKLDSYLNNLNDKFLWQSPSCNILKEKFINEKKNYILMCELFEGYVSYLIKIKMLWEERIINIKKGTNL